jgi:hypothetical protein
MKWNKPLQVGDLVGLIGLHHAYPRAGIVRVIDGSTIGIHWLTGAKVFANTSIFEQTLFVHKKSVVDFHCWRGWLKFFFRSIRT